MSDPYGTVLLPYFFQSGECWQWPARFVFGHLSLHWRQFSKKSFQTVQDFGLKEAVLSNIYASLFSFLCLSLFIKCRRRVVAKKATAYLT